MQYEYKAAAVRENKTKDFCERLVDSTFLIIWVLSVKHTLYLYLMYNMFRLTIESSSGPYIKIQILIYSKRLTGSQTPACFVLIYIMTSSTIFLLHW
jgi:hypothetical protein